MLVGRRQLEIVQSPHILHVQDLEDVVHTGCQFEIGAMLVHDEGAFGEHHERRVLAVLLEEGVVLVGERSPEHLHTKVFAPLEFLQQGDAVEDLAVHVP